jgi:hypothetical protein
MSDPARDKKSPVPDKTKSLPPQDEEAMEEEEKILAGRDDVNYPAHLTKDVKGG